MKQVVETKQKTITQKKKAMRQKYCSAHEKSAFPEFEARQMLLNQVKTNKLVNLRG